MFTRKTKGKSAKGLTPTQLILLTHAKAGPIRMLRGDRLGTRCVGHEEGTGTAQIVAYGQPEWFLVGRGLLRARNERHCYDITEAGLALLPKDKPEA